MPHDHGLAREKRFHPANYGAGDSGDRIHFTLHFQNHLHKAVRAFRALLLSRTCLMSSFWRVTLTHEAGISARGNAVWQGGMEYNQFLASHQRFLSVDLHDMAVFFELESVIYGDGTRVDLRLGLRCNLVASTPLGSSLSSGAQRLTPESGSALTEPRWFLLETLRRTPAWKSRASRAGWCPADQGWPPAKSWHDCHRWGLRHRP